MATESKVFENSEYAIGWIAALSHERAAAEAMLDVKHAAPQSKHEKDDNIYTLGAIHGPNGEHNVVIASLPPGRYGTTAAASAATQMLSSFPAIKFGLVVGIGGGIPSEENDIRLGDVVVSKPEGTFWGVRQYDCGKATAHDFKESGALNSPPRVLLNAIGALESKHEMEGSSILNVLKAMYRDYPLMAKPRKGPGYIHQGEDQDRLFRAEYEHIVGKNECTECDNARTVQRQERPDQDPFIHYGTIASGNQVIKDARKRDKISKTCLCFETEAAGLMNEFPCLVIRGICDYYNTHKSDRWQRYAAATAAAYAKELLQVIEVADVRNSQEARELLEEVREIKSIAHDIVHHEKQQHLDKKLQGMFKWLFPLDPSARHSENKKQRVEGTSKWIFEDPKFLDWSSERPNHQTLACYGDPGAGKTILASLVIDELKEMALVSRSGLGYMYCDYRDQKEQTTENIFGALIRQLLVMLSPNIPAAALEVYDKRHVHGPFGLAEANNLSEIVCAQFETIYISLDALDELTDLRSLLVFLHDRPRSMLLFMTGGPYVKKTVQTYLEEQYIIHVEAHESDIRQYIRREIGGASDIEPDAMDERLRTDIFKTIIDSASGM